MFTFLWLYIQHKQFNHIDNLQLVCWNWLAFIECWHPCSLVKPRDMKLWLWFGRVDDAEKISVSVFAARAISCSLGYCHVLCLQIKVQSRLSLLQLQMKDLLFSCPWMMIDAITWCCSSSISGHTLQTIRHGSHLQSTSHLPIHCISCDDFGDLKKDDSVSDRGQQEPHTMFIWRAFFPWSVQHINTANCWYLVSWMIIMQLYLSYIHQD